MVNDYLPDAGQHNQQSDAAHSERFGDRPKENEEAQSQKDVVDTFAAQVFADFVFEEILRQGLSAGQYLFCQPVFGFPLLVAVVEDNEKNKYRHTEYGYDGDDTDQGFTEVVVPVVLAVCYLVPEYIGSFPLFPIRRKRVFIGGDAECVGGLYSVHHCVVQFDNLQLFSLIIFEGDGTVLGLHRQAE